MSFRKKSETKSLCEHIINWKETLNFHHIWNWNDEVEYYKFITIFSFFMLTFCFFEYRQKFFFEVVGTVSVACETFIELPQIKENCNTKNIDNLSGTMIFLWLVGDLFKTWYNVVYKSPMQMLVGGIVMNCEDIILNSQMIIYSENNFVGKYILRRKQTYVNLDDDKAISNSNKIDFDENKNLNGENA